jgi:short-subunit dehydrogenase
MGTALVTGASAGLGRAYAVELARRGHDLVLVARNRERLQQLADELAAAHGIRVEVLPADLADRQQVEAVARRVADPHHPVDLLVNNAGFGLGRRFLSSEIEELEQALDVMVRAVLVLTHAAARAMRERGHGAVLNVSSVASYAVMGPYSAIKSWVTVFSEAVAADLAGTGVQVTAVCPGFVHTEFHQRAGMNMSRLPEVGWLTAEQVVRESLDDLARGKVVSVPSRRYRAAIGVLRHAPRGLVRRGSTLVARRRSRG